MMYKYKQYKKNNKHICRYLGFKFRVQKANKLITKLMVSHSQNNFVLSYPE